MAKASKFDAKTSPPVLQRSKNDGEASSPVPAEVENDAGGYECDTTAMVVEEFAFDAALMREERELGLMVRFARMFDAWDDCTKEELRQMTSLMRLARARVQARKDGES